MQNNKYLKVFEISFLHAAKNYRTVIGLSLFLVVCMIIFSNLWEVLSVKTRMLQMNRNQLLWYVALNQWVLIAIPRVDRDIQFDFQTGKLTYLLTRPISYLKCVFFEGLGTLIVNLIGLGIVTFIVTTCFVGWLPIPFFSWCVFILLALLAGILEMIFFMMIGVSSFWMHDCEPLAWIWEKFLFAFGGLILPLSIYPQYLQTIANYSPFPLILGGRSSLVFDFNFHQTSVIFFSMLAWILIASLILVALFRKGLKNLTIEGG